MDSMRALLIKPESTFSGDGNLDIGALRGRNFAKYNQNRCNDCEKKRNYEFLSYGGYSKIESSRKKKNNLDIWPQLA